MDTQTGQDCLGSQAVTAAINKLSDTDQMTPVHLAAASSTSGASCLQLLLKALTQHKTTDNLSPSSILTVPGGVDHSYPLHLAALHGRLDRLDLLIGFGASLEARTRSGDTALHIASTRGHDLIVRNLLRGGSRWDVPGRHGSSAIHCAAMSGCLDCLYRLLIAATESGEKPNCYDGESERDSSFYPSVSADLASLGESPEIHARLHQLVKLVDQYGRTLVHAAALGANMDCLKLVLLAGGDPFCTDSDGWTSLHYAAASCSFSIGSPYSLESASVDSSSIHRPSSRSHPWAFRANAIEQAVACSLVFLKLGTNVNLADRYGCTALHLACAFDTTGQLVSELIAYGADIFVRTAWFRFPRDADGPESNANEPRYSPLHIAVNCSNVPAVKTLLSACPEHLLATYIVGTIAYCDDSFNSQPDQPLSPFLLAAIRGNEKIMQLFIESWIEAKKLGIPSDRSILPGQLCDHSGRTALHFAAFQGNLGICRLLLEHSEHIGTSVYHKDSVYRWNALHHAASQGHVDVVKLFVFRELNTSTESQPSLAVFDSFIEDVDEHGRTALMLASQSNHTNVIKFLLSLGTSSALNATDAYGRTALHRSVANGHEFCVELLLQSGADPTIADFRRRQALHMAAAGGRANTLMRMLRHLAQSVKDRGEASDSLFSRDLLCPLDQHGFTPLHFAAYGGHSECIQAMFHMNGYERIRGNVYTPIHCAAQSGHLDCLKLLLNRYGTDCAMILDSKGRTALHIAALTDHADCLTELLHFMEPKSALSPVHPEGTTDAQKQQLSFASFVLQRDNDDRTALMLAATTGTRTCVECLLDVHIRLNTELSLLRDSGLVDCDLITSLMEASSLGATDNEARTVLHLACTASLDDAALAVLDRLDDVLITRPDRLRRTALHLAIASGIANVTEVLISRGADLYAVDNDGCIPVLAAAPSLPVATCLSLGLAAMFPPIGETVAENPFLRTTPNRPYSGSVCQNFPIVLETQLVDRIPQNPSPPARTESCQNPEGDFF